MSSNNAALSMENIIINRVIGHGSFSTVYLGHLGGSAQQKPDLQQMSSNKEPQLACAIKVVDRFKLNRKLLSALEREIDIMSGLCEHPNIIRYLAHQVSLIGLSLICLYDKTHVRNGWIMKENDCI